MTSTPSPDFVSVPREATEAMRSLHKVVEEFLAHGTRCFYCERKLKHHVDCEANNALIAGKKAIEALATLSTAPAPPVVVEDGRMPSECDKLLAIEDMQERFESWMASGNYPEIADVALERLPDGQYKSQLTFAAWQTWQAVTRMYAHPQPIDDADVERARYAFCISADADPAGKYPGKKHIRAALQAFTNARGK